MNLPTELVACKHFRWVPGMCGYSPSQDSYHRYNDPGVWVERDVGVVSLTPLFDLQPVLSDPATAGGALHLVKEVWGAPHAFTKRHGLTGRFFVGGLPDLRIFWGDSPEEAVALALLGAPDK